MNKTITTNTAVAYAQCPRKAFLLLSDTESGPPHEYVQILAQKQQANHTAYLEKVAQAERDVHPYSTNGLESTSAYLTDVTLKTEMWEANCSLLTKVGTHSALGRYSYEPTICVGTHSISREQKLALFFVAHVLEQLQKKPPAKGTIVDGAGKAHKINLAESAKTLPPVREPLQEWLAQDAPAEPPVILNEHCPLCQFRTACRAKAEQENSLSLLDRMTPKVMRKLERKGIFTVTQLSYTFRPRKRKKRAKNPPPVTHSLELQALAIREGKIYLQELPQIDRHPVELFLDIEGIPDQNLYYLIGLLVCENESSTHHSFWADGPADEKEIWQQFVEKANEYPGAPIYHYGSYEAMALKKLAKRYDTGATALLPRLVNVNGFIYGKVYFPIYSNRLKEIGQFIGAKWSTAEASGLQSLVWRYYWEETQKVTYQEALTVYNREDCATLKVLTDKLAGLGEKADEVARIESDDLSNLYKFGRTKYEIDELKVVNDYAYFDYQRERVYIRTSRSIQRASKREEKRFKHANKVNVTVEIVPPEICPKCNSRDIRLHQNYSAKIVIDLKFFDGGIKKWVTSFRRKRFRCYSCNYVFTPEEHKQSHKFGHNLKIWAVNQYVAHRISAQKIENILLESFKIRLTDKQIYYFLSEYVDIYRSTYEETKKILLSGKLLHADETQISVQGIQKYVWVFTNIDSVLFLFKPTREADFLQEMLKDFSGVLISDFYAGYDSVPCIQQKCLVHLIRDMNDDLFHNPFDVEFREIVSKFSKLLRAIVATIDTYGLSRRHLHKHTCDVNKFYDHVACQNYESQLVVGYQKKLVKYRERLFTFLNHDNIPWNNNNAERAIKAFATYRRTTDGLYTDNSISDYLILFSIQQTCKYRGLSFLEFLQSGEMSLEQYSRKN